MAGPATTAVNGKIGDQGVSLSVQMPKQNFANPAIYYPAIPGIAVALIGLWVGHVLTERRERRSEVSKLCEALKTAAEKATEVATQVWLANHSSERDLKIADAKRKFHMVGIAATGLKKIPAYGRIKWPGARKPISVDVVGAAGAFRRASISDPFEDPQRIASKDSAADAAEALGIFMVEIDKQFAAAFR
ncbi:hypothetical protein [Bosea beijingensis]